LSAVEYKNRINSNYPTSKPRLPTPREHGAWGLIFQPFLAAVWLAANPVWLYVPALGLVLCGFLIREPAVVWIRHSILWKKPESAESRAAARWTLAVGAAALVCVLCLWQSLSPWQASVLFGSGAALTAASVWLTVRNQQRSIVLQVVSACGLTSTAPLTALVSESAVPRWAWILWVVLTAHAIAAIPIVHARLQFRARKSSAPGLRWSAAGLQCASLLAAGALFAGGSHLWIPVLFSATVNLLEVIRLANPQHLAEPLKRVGLRLLLVSLLHTVLTVAAMKYP